MNPDLLTFAFVMAVCVPSVACLAVVGAWVFRTVRRASEPQRLAPANDDERFVRLQQSVDAIAVEVERLAEAQRYSTRLAADRVRVPAMLEER